MSKNKHSVLSFSGGVDSTSLMIRLLNKGYSVHAVSFNYGQKHQIEIELAQKNISYLKENGFNKQVAHRVFDVSNVFESFNSSLLNKDMEVPEGHYEDENMKSTFVPNRNAIFFSMVYGYALSLSQKISDHISISMAVHSGDHEIYPDCRLDFFKQLFNSFQIGNWDSDKIQLYLPYIDKDKAAILLDAYKSIENLGLDFDKIFKNTITSYNPNKSGVSSGKSGSDIERILAFNSINKKDPIQYQESWEEVLEHALKVEKEFKG